MREDEVIIAKALKEGGGRDLRWVVPRTVFRDPGFRTLDPWGWDRERVFRKRVKRCRRDVREKVKRREVARREGRWRSI